MDATDKPAVKPWLSILVCSLKCRAHYLARLLGILNPQLSDRVELLVDTDDGDIPIGAKRQRMLERAAGRYLCFIDDDDVVATDYIARILAATDQNPDVIGFNVRRMVDGVEVGYAEHSIRNQDWSVKLRDGKAVMTRSPYHLNPVRSELARKVGFQPWNHKEDRDYAERIRPLLKTEVFIDELLYTYEFRRTRPGETANRERKG